MAETLYLKIGQKIVVARACVTVGDLGTLWCSNASVLAKCSALHYKTMHQQRSVESILNVITVIQQEYPEVTVENLGETDFILEQRQKETSRCWSWAKVLAVCLIIFFGAGFSIITFNEDVSVLKVFEDLHLLMTGQERKGLTWLEGGYAIGLFLGIILFYNHFQRKASRMDPTPLEVEMDTYEKELNQAVFDRLEKETQKKRLNKGMRKGKNE